MVILKTLLISNFSQPTRNQVRHGKRFVQQWLLCYSWSKSLDKMYIKTFQILNKL